MRLVIARDVQFFLGPDDDPRSRECCTCRRSRPPLRRGVPRPRRHRRPLSTLFRLSQGGGGEVLVARRRAARRVIPRREFGALCDLVLPGEDVDREALAALCSRAATCACRSSRSGTFAVRGGVIDVFPPLYRYPARHRSPRRHGRDLRLFDPRSQRTCATCRTLPAPGPRDGAHHRRRSTRHAPRRRRRGRPSSAKTRALLEQIEAGRTSLASSAGASVHAAMAPIDEYLPDAAHWFCSIRRR